MSISIAINAGSSSLKFKLYEMPEEKVIASGVLERIGIGDSIVTIKHNGEKFEEVLDIDDHEVAVEHILEKLIQLNILDSYDSITGVGHRVVAGGELFDDSVIITNEIIEQIEGLSELAPLHNPANITGIRAMMKVLPDVIQVAVFDTSFHQTMPEVNYIYSIPYEYYEDYDARKYGAHGTSHQYVSERAAELSEKDIKELKIITLHLGNGASITAVEGGKSVDTSMGFTPLAGVTMGTRSGDIDASLLPYLMDKLELDDVQDMIDILNNKSGLLGLSDVSSDMRDIEDAAAEGNERAQLALDVFADRVKKYIGQYIATMNGVDVIIFTAGVGENSPEMRKKIISGISTFGVELDDELNNIRGEERVISTEDSDIQVMLIPTDEELVIARDIERLRK